MYFSRRDRLSSVVLPGTRRNRGELTARSRAGRDGAAIAAILAVFVVSPVVASDQWVQLGSDIVGEHSEDLAGLAVAFAEDGVHVVVGAPLSDENGDESGQVRVFRWGVSDWSQMGPTITGEEAYDKAGISVAVSSDGRRFAVGEPGHGATLEGRVRVFEWLVATSQWILLDPGIDGEKALDHAGLSVALSADGTRVAVGAPTNSDVGPQSGQVQVYQRVGPSWTQLGFDLEGEAAGDLAGQSVALSGDGTRVAIGAPENSGNGAAAGHVRVYRWSATTQSWSRVGTDIDGVAAGDQSGTSVALSADGSRVAIGAPGNSSDTGYARVLEWNGTTWVQLGPLLDGNTVGDLAGTSVALSPDGGVVAVGAPQNDGAGVDSGHVKVYRWSAPSQTWHSVGPELHGVEPFEWSGASIGLAAGGSAVAIGSPQNDGNGTNAGDVRVFIAAIFADGFETGDTSAWTGAIP